jgi:hypothetical protein
MRVLVALLAAGVALGVVIGSADSIARPEGGRVGWAAQPAPGREVVLIDQATGNALALQVDPTAPSGGSFAFRATGRGVYTGQVGAGMQVISPSSVVVNYSGAATLSDDVSVTNPPDTGAQPTSVVIGHESERT